MVLGHHYDEYRLCGTDVLPGSVEVQGPAVMTRDSLLVDELSLDIGTSVSREVIFLVK